LSKIGESIEKLQLFVEKGLCTHQIAVCLAHIAVFEPQIAVCEVQIAVF